MGNGHVILILKYHLMVHITLFVNFLKSAVINSAVLFNLKYEGCWYKNVTALLNDRHVLSVWTSYPEYHIACIECQLLIQPYMHWVSNADRATGLQHSIVGNDKHILTLLLCPWEINLTVTSKVETHSFILELPGNRSDPDTVQIHHTSFCSWDTKMIQSAACEVCNIMLAVLLGCLLDETLSLHSKNKCILNCFSLF